MRVENSKKAFQIRFLLNFGRLCIEETAQVNSEHDSLFVKNFWTKAPNRKFLLLVQKSGLRLFELSERLRLA